MKAAPALKNTPVIALIGCEAEVLSVFLSADFGNKKVISFADADDMFIAKAQQGLNIAAIVSQSEIRDQNGLPLLDIFRNKMSLVVPFFLVSRNIDTADIPTVLQAGVSEVFILPLKQENIELRLNLIVDHWDALKAASSANVMNKFKTPAFKRVFDIVFASLAILFFLPLFIVVAILLKIESRGPIFYYAIRVGAGYRTFKFYKFRSMYVNADRRLKDLKHLNQYGSSEASSLSTSEAFLCDDCKLAGTQCQFPLYSDTISWCEKQYSDSQKTQSAFFKAKNDPRITPLGKFIRNTSIDELPQLWNVIIGDMSIVGNRPLPLYEAEKLTTDKYAIRFMAPAGITGLWQVEKRGKEEMSVEERLMLDNQYAQHSSFLGDIKLLFRTIPALLQRETV